jgi:hypothetical protein
MKTAVRKNIEGSHMNKDVFGIHHVTAITSEPQRNMDFYTNNLALRFVKFTVNQDAWRICTL